MNNSRWAAETIPNYQSNKVKFSTTSETRRGREEYQTTLFIDDVEIFSVKVDEYEGYEGLEFSPSYIEIWHKWIRSVGLNPDNF